MHYRTFALLLLLIGLVVPLAAARGNFATYLPFVSKPAPRLPSGPLLLTHQDRNLVWVNPDGTYRHQITQEGDNDSAIVSPNGQFIAYQQQTSNSNRHYLIPAIGGTPRELPIYISRRTWSPDSQFIAWVEYNNVSYNVYTYHIATGATNTIDTNAQDVYTWHPDTNQIYFLTEISEDDVTLYRSNADGSGRTLTLDTPDTEWMLQVIPDGQVIVSAYNPQRYLIGAIQPDGSNYTLLKDLPRGVIVVSTSPYGSGFFYELEDVHYFDDITGATAKQFTLPCGPEYESCSRSLVRWGRNEFAFRWLQRESQYEFVYTLYSLATTLGATPRPLATGSIGEFQYSPDGRYLAYEVDRDLVIYDTTTQQVVSTLPDTELQMWRP